MEGEYSHKKILFYSGIQATFVAVTCCEIQNRYWNGGRSSDYTNMWTINWTLCNQTSIDSYLNAASEHLNSISN